MKQRHTIGIEQVSTLPSSQNHSGFRIRSSSRDKFISSLLKWKQKSFTHHEKEKKQLDQPLLTERMKTSHKELRKIVIHRKHERQRSSDMENLFKNNLMETTEQSLGQQPKAQNFVLNNKKIVYKGVKTEQMELGTRKNWVDINSLDTSEDIKILDRITNMCDPFRIIKQCNSRQKIDRRSEEPRVKSISVKKSKLTDKINNLVFEMNSKSKQKNGFKIHRNKFETLNNSNRLKESMQKSSDKLKEQSSNESNIHKQTSPITNSRCAQVMPCSISSVPKELQISSELVQKSSIPASGGPIIRISKNNPILQTQSKNKNRLNIAKQNSKNQVLDKFWSGVNQSLILAAQEQYVSKDLNELLYNNMH